MLRDELLEREAFETLLEAKVLIERRRQHYNTIRPHSALGYRPPAPEAMQPCAVGGQNPNLEPGVIHGGRSPGRQRIPPATPPLKMSVRLYTP